MPLQNTPFWPKKASTTMKYRASSAPWYVYIVLEFNLPVVTVLPSLAPSSTGYSPEDLSTTTPFKSTRALPRSCSCFFMVSRGIRRPCLYISCTYSFYSLHFLISYFFTPAVPSPKNHSKLTRPPILEVISPHFITEAYDFHNFFEGFTIRILFSTSTTWSFQRAYTVLRV